MVAEEVLREREEKGGIVVYESTAASPPYQRSRGLPYELRFPLAWFLAFSIIGIAIQSIRAGSFVFLDFFGANYVTWFKSFGAFSETVRSQGYEALFYSLAGEWYYFFYTGGLLALVWGFVNWIVNFEYNKK